MPAPEQADVHARQLCEYLAALSVHDLDPKTLESAESLVLDHVLCADIGMGQEWVRILREQLATEFWSGAETADFSAIYGSRDRVPPRVAALVNGTASHGLELDDSYIPGAIHPGAVVIPAVTAAAYKQGISGTDVLLAVVAGYEALGRLGRAVGTSHTFRGFHGTGLLGPVAAAIAVSKVLGLGAERMHSAAAVAASLGGGLKAFQMGPGMVKRLHAGRAAEGGLLAAQLAARGFEGPFEAIEGRFGFLEVYDFDGKGDAASLSADLGGSYVVDDVYIKPFPSCGGVHAPIFATLELMEKDGISASDIRVMEVGVTEKSATQNSIQDLRDALTAQYSIEYGVALTWVGQVHDLRRYTDASHYDDPVVRELMSKIRVGVDAEAESRFPAYRDARASVELNNGETAARYFSLDAQSSSGADQVREKCRRLWQGVRPAEQVEALIGALSQLKSGGTVPQCLAILEES